MKFTFGDIVVVDKIEIGVIVKCWIHNADVSKEFNYDVYEKEYYELKIGDCYNCQEK